MLQFPDAVRYANQVTKNLETRVEFQALNSLFPKTKAGATAIETPITSARIMSMLPDWTACDQLIKIYCHHCENINRIMHLPSLLSAYRQLRESGKDVNPFIPQFALIIVIASRLWRKDSDTEVRVVLDPQKICLRVGRWLAELADKERMTFPTLQTYTLLVIASKFCPAHRQLSSGEQQATSCALR